MISVKRMNFADHLNKGFIILIFAILFYVILAFYSDYGQILNNWRRIETSYIPGIIMCIVLSGYLKSIRQKFLLNIVSIKISLKDSFVIFFAGLSLLVTPGASGTFVKAYFLKQKLGANISKTIPVILIERYLDMIGILSILSLFSIFLYLKELVVPILIIDIFLVIVLFMFKSRKLPRVIVFFLKKLRRGDDFMENTTQFHESIVLLTSKKNMLVTIPFSMISWMVDVITFYLCFLSFGLSLNIIETALISLSSLAFGFITLIPGGLGVTEVSMITFLTRRGIDLSLASSLVLFTRMWTMWFVTFLGFITIRIALKKST